MTESIETRNTLSIWAKAGAVVVFAALVSACGGGGGAGDPVAPPPPPAVAAPVITQQPASQTVQEGSAVTLSVSVQTEATLTYQWLRNGAEVGSANSSSHLIPAAVLAESGSRWSVRVTNAGGSVTSNEAVLTVTARPVVVTPLGVTVFKAADASRPDEKPIGVDRSGQVITVSGDGTAPTLRKYGPDGQPRQFGDKATIVLAPPTGQEPMSYAVDRDGVVYVAYTRLETLSVAGGVFNFASKCEIYRISSAGEATQVLLSRGGDPDFKAAGALAVDAQGALHMTDWVRGVVLRREPDGTWTDQSLENLIYRLGAAPSTALAVGPAGAYLTHAARRLVEKLSAPTSLPVVAGNTGKPAAIADGPGTDAQFKQLGAIVTDSAGNAYVTDWLTIRKMTPSGSVTTVVGGTDDPLRVAFRALPDVAYGLAIDAAGVLYFGTGGQIWKVRLQ
jgi:hypothetical protein